MEDNLMLRCLLDSTESTEAALFLFFCPEETPAELKSGRNPCHTQNVSPALGVPWRV